VTPIKARLRLWEIDTLRGIAVVLMVYFHGVAHLTGNIG